ncbi:MAG TPA: hypothetical protein VF799_04355, partial [Geobacteraceae bacterium]
ASEKRVHGAFQKMQEGFQNELSAVNSRVRARRGTPLTDSRRGVHIARSSRSIAKLQVIDQVQAANLVKLAKYGKFLGQGLTVIDFGSRVGNVKNSYDAGGNWERDMFIESSSFTLSAITGIAVVNAGATALACLVAATPAGWVLIVAGLAVAGVAAGSSMWVNNTMKSNGGHIYDKIMEWMNTL